MQGHIYDIERPGKPCEFIITTEYLKGCVCWTHENAKLLEEMLTDFSKTSLEEPNNPRDNQRLFFKQQIEIKEYYKDKADLEKLKFAF